MTNNFEKTQVKEQANCKKFQLTMKMMTSAKFGCKLFVDFKEKSRSKCDSILEYEKKKQYI